MSSVCTVMLADLGEVVGLISTSMVISAFPVPDVWDRLTHDWSTDADQIPDDETLSDVVDFAFETSILFRSTVRNGESSFSHLNMSKASKKRML